MSAFVVAKAHIDVMVAAALLGGRDAMTIEHPDHPGQWGQVTELDHPHAREVGASRIGEMLWVENVRSVNSRYTEDELTEVYTYPANTHYRLQKVPRAELLPILFKTVACYEYQSCEHDGWESSWAHNYCNRLFRYLAGLLPGWGNAPGWAIDSLDEISPPDNSVNILNLGRKSS